MTRYGYECAAFAWRLSNSFAGDVLPCTATPEGRAVWRYCAKHYSDPCRLVDLLSAHCGATNHARCGDDGRYCLCACHD